MGRNLSDGIHLVNSDRRNTGKRHGKQSQQRLNNQFHTFRLSNNINGNYLILDLRYQ